MTESLSILRQAVEGKLPDYVDINSGIDLHLFSELIGRGYIEAIDATDDGGAAFLEPKITFAGREFLDKGKDTNVQNVVINQYGSNSRVNQDSTDNSVNIVNDLMKYISDLRSEIQKVITDIEEKNEYLELVDTVQEQIESGKPKKSVIKSLLKSLPNVASITSIIQFILSMV